MQSFNSTSEYYLWTLSLADSRTRGWLLVDSPLPTIVLTLLYLSIVYKGPKVMKNKNAFHVKWLLVIYNLAIAILNGYIGYEFLVASTRLQYNYICQPLVHTNVHEEMRIVNAIWWYYFSKLLEFCDTFFFILRKKDTQLTFLHVYHHSTMFPLWWIAVKWVPAGSSFFSAMVNSFVHVIMYSYYGLSALGPAVNKYLWWKRYITKLQLIQLTAVLISSIYGMRSECGFPKLLYYSLGIYMSSLIILFANFYVQAYIAQGKKKI